MESFGSFDNGDKKMPKNEGAANFELARGIETQEFIDRVMSGFQLGSMKRDTVIHILKEEERTLRTAGESEEAIKTALENKLRRLGAH